MAKHIWTVTIKQSKREYEESTNDKTFSTSILFHMLFYMHNYENKPAEANINTPSLELKFNRAKQKLFQAI